MIANEDVKYLKKMLLTYANKYHFVNDRIYLKSFFFFFYKNALNPIFRHFYNPVMLSN